MSDNNRPWYSPFSVRQKMPWFVILFSALCLYLWWLP